MTLEKAISVKRVRGNEVNTPIVEGLFKEFTHKREERNRIIAVEEICYHEVRVF